MLTGLDLTFMGITRSNSGLFSTPGFIISPVGKRERGEKGRREGGKKGLENERKEEGIKKYRRQDKEILTKIKTKE